MLWWLAAAIVVIASALTGVVVRLRFLRKIARDIARIQSAPAPTPTHRSLPPMLEAFVVGRCAEDIAPPSWVRIEQTGALRLKEDGDWMDFVAEQYFSTANPAFVWIAHLRFLTVVDALAPNGGYLEARALGIVPVAKAGGADTTRGELMRYLAEIPWCPFACIANRAVAFEQTDAKHVVASAHLGNASATVTFAFDKRGDIAEVSGLRPRTVGKKSVDTPWLGVFSDYRTVNGVRIPTRGEVNWILDGEPFTYWRGTVHTLEYR